MLTIGDEIKTLVPLQAEYRPILTPEALAFLNKLHQAFNPIRLELIEARRTRQQVLDRCTLPTFLPRPSAGS